MNIFIFSCALELVPLLKSMSTCYLLFVFNIFCVEFADLTLSCVSSKQFGSLSFAIMCGLVVPIALAHACCALSLLAQVAAAQIVPAQFRFLGWWSRGGNASQPCGTRFEA